ncbi:MAG: AmmeMemoRadiSam system protein A [gamma proteobacterium symbiont of Bathyaustriella thionipta]|nr:AmmeMemoRadiSam system protein A [gamma proteobacterium symbiont of Bathyaustriella thionipta]MCU7950201.1 AmmeMemoRadiSam system protein A [gamma proteobacterium symbiont of Bathyaustriella thionipta]MCU7953796.1 AmmeMemoRadiSam system protein A [gamma proteobacterium symbiont of Bathyaustriella thionipta]MCU7956743.1 AmmeMemoRadiSam system protein A [gamma proteobacterium symbiont of Bathyaustriella thionipta]MCU7968935.1 AmmeMemoRadiSam system protein A [gamma proteobacterium symbiont of 
MYSQEEQQILHDIAQKSIQTGLTQQHPLAVTLNDYAEHLQQKRATFVTLNINKQLRGCIGTLKPFRALVDDISHNAYAAAFSDPRFPALRQAEFSQLDYHLSILSDTSPMAFNSEADLLTQIRPGIDGLVLSDQNQQGTFLPSVWEQLPTAEEFLQQLKRKAGFPADYWSDSLSIRRYTVESF